MSYILIELAICHAFLKENLWQPILATRDFLFVFPDISLSIWREAFYISCGNRYQISSEGQSIPFKETGMDPLCLDQINPSVHSYINEIKDILLGQLKKDNPCDISLDTLTLLGEMLLGIEQHATLKERLGLT